MVARHVVRYAKALTKGGGGEKSPRFFFLFSEKKKKKMNFLGNFPFHYFPKIYKKRTGRKVINPIMPEDMSTPSP